MMEYRHHIIPKHEWKRRFRNLVGFNAQDNWVILTLEQHIQAHQLLYELNSNEWDRIAYQGMSGMIGAEEIHRERRSIANIGNKHSLGYKFSKEDLQRRSDRMKRNKFALGLKRGPWTEERKIRKSQSMMGNRYGANK